MSALTVVETTSSSATRTLIARANDATTHARASEKATVNAVRACADAATRVREVHEESTQDLLAASRRVLDASGRIEALEKTLERAKALATRARAIEASAVRVAKSSSSSRQLDD
jgi:hypothetical protein